MVKKSIRYEKHLARYSVENMEIDELNANHSVHRFGAIAMLDFVLIHIHKKEKKP